MYVHMCDCTVKVCVDPFMYMCLNLLLHVLCMYVCGGHI